MEIGSLSQLIRALKMGRTFTIVEHYLKPEHTGEVRCVQKLQTNGVYTGIAGQPDHPVSRANYGKGFWIAFGKASDWEFVDGLCTQSIKGEKIWTIRFEEARK